MTGGSASHSSAFPPTRLSIIDRIRSGEPEVRRQAFGALAAGYWKPIYKYVRIKWRAPCEEAEDLTQAFLTAAYEKGYFESFDPNIARFRTFLRTCLDRFVMNQHKAHQRAKRGGGIEFVGLDFQSAEGEIRNQELRDPVDLDAFFRQELIRDLFSRTLLQMREQLESKGKILQLRLFERYDLEPESGTSYADLGREFEISVTQVTNHLAAARRAFRAQALENLREISGTDEEYRNDAREIFGIEIE